MLINPGYSFIIKYATSAEIIVKISQKIFTYLFLYDQQQKEKWNEYFYVQVH
jgi:hypothetical protein